MEVIECEVVTRGGDGEGGWGGGGGLSVKLPRSPSTTAIFLNN